MTTIETEAHALADAYELAALKLSPTDLRAFVIHQSAWLRKVHSPADSTVYTRRAEEWVVRLAKASTASAERWAAEASSWCNRFLSTAG